MPSLKLENWAPASFRKHILGQEILTIDALCQLMMESDGEYSSYLISDRVLTAFEKLDEEETLSFFNTLNDEYDLDIAELNGFVKDYAEDPSDHNLRAITHAAEPRRQELFRRLNMAPHGTKRLVKMREKLLKLSRSHSELKRMDVDFKHLFGSWFNRGFLTMEPIDWTSPAHILEKIIAYEAVHEIGSWRELRARLEPADRRCYAFFHPAMEDEPLVFVEVALMDDIPDKIDDILSPEREQLSIDQANCAIFYSISNCHTGLAGVSFGNFLIKHVATHLQQEIPQIKKFVTLSPVPGFKKWLESNQSPEEAALLLEQSATNEDASDLDSLLPLAAEYFLNQKTSAGEPLDPVARFHLKNGARLERLNLAADTSEKGQQQSLGLMVNYHYNLEKVEENHERYMKAGEVTASSGIKKHLPRRIFS